MIKILFLSILGWAQVDFTPSEQIIMKGKTCQELEHHAQSIVDWSFLISKQQKAVPECYCSSKSCQMDVASISPYFVKDVTNFNVDSGIATPVSGPNCFNAALVANKTQEYIRFTHPREMTVILSSSMCREIPLTESLEPGDILVVRDQNTPHLEVHAGVYVNEQLSFSKYGESSMMPYSYGLNVERVYGVKDDACRRIQGIPNAQHTCYKKPFVNFFTCIPLSSFISKIFNSPSGIQPDVRKVYADTAGIDLRVSDIVFKGARIKKEDILLHQKNLTRLYEESLVVSKNNTLNEQNKQLLRLTHARIFSLHEQVRRIGKSMNDKDLMVQELPVPSL